MRVWVTRAQPHADETAATLRARGCRPLVAPLLEVRPLPGPLDLDGVGALAFTSRNAVAAFAVRTPERRWPVFAVGDATAHAARAAGFHTVESADGDVDALARLIARRGVDGVLLHPGAAEPAGDLAGALAAGGVRVRSMPVDETVALPPAPEAVAAWPNLDAVLIHSPKAARALAAANLPTGPRLLCISTGAAEPLRAAGYSPAVAARPDEAALLMLVKPWRRVMPVGVWIALVFGLACVAAGWAVAAWGPALWPGAALGAKDPRG